MADPRFSRRALLLGAGVVALGGGAGTYELLRGGFSTSTTSGLPGTEPTVLASSNGRLEVDLTVAWTDTTLGGRPARLLTYNGTSPGPTMVVSPGDTLVVRVTNRSGVPTNLHTHGLHVSPAGHGDNVFVSIPDGGERTYTYELASSHEPGPAWYHPHHHTTTAEQLFQGLHGALIVRDPGAPPDLTERVLLVHDTTLTADGQVAAVSTMQKRMGREGELVCVNGQLAPTYTGRTGDVERWRVINACPSRYLSLRVDGAEATLLGMDMGRLTNPAPAGTLDLAPGNRADLLVRLGSSTASLRYTTRPRGGMGARVTGGRSYSDEVIASVIPSGAAVNGSTPALPFAMPDLRPATPAAQRRFTLGMGEGGGMGQGGGMGGGAPMTINGVTFDPTATNTSVRIGDVEEWTIINPTGLDHPFHLHVWPMQVLSIGGKPVDGVIYQDVVDVPAGTQSVVRVHFDAYPGRTMYHCHILDHEDLGMMGVIAAS